MLHDNSYIDTKGNQNFATFEVTLWDIDFKLLIKKLASEWTFLPKRFRENSFKKEILECCLGLIWVKYGK